MSFPAAELHALLHLSDPGLQSALVEALATEQIEGQIVQEQGALAAVLAAQPSSFVICDAATVQSAIAVVDQLRTDPLLVAPAVVLVAPPAALADPPVGPVDIAVLSTAPAVLQTALSLIRADRHRRVAWDQLLGASCLNRPSSAALQELQDEVAGAMGVDGCRIAMGQSSGPSEVPGGGRSGAMADRGYWQLSAALEATVLVPRPAAVDAREVQSYFAAPIRGRGERARGLLGVVATDGRLFHQDERRALNAVAARIAFEFEWRLLHERLLTEIDGLRECPHLDPRLAIWTRPGLEYLAAMRFADAARSGQTLGVLVLHLHSLHAVNQRVGHTAGDATLRAVADVVRSSTRTEDVVGRYGGDRIAIIGVVQQPGDTVLIVERILARLAEQAIDLGEGQQIPIQVVAGITTTDAVEESPMQALARGASAAHRARKEGLISKQIEQGAPRPGTQARSSQNLSSYRADESVTLGGTYRVLHEISSGAMGVVYRGEDMGLGRPVAIKMLRPDLASDEKLVARFRSEAAILARLRHPSLVQVYAFGTEGDDTYFVMELVEGESLDDTIHRCEREDVAPPLGPLRSVFFQVASALDALHEAGIVHRDVKPANILLDPFRKRAVLVDVGVARRFGENDEAAGTPGFVAPEVLAGEDATPRSDVFGLAATAYTMLAMTSPWGDSDDAWEIVDRQLSELPRPLGELRPELAALDEVLLAGLDREPTRRPPTASAFAEAFIRDLDELVGDGHAVSEDGAASSSRRSAEGAGRPPPERVSTIDRLCINYVRQGVPAEAPEPLGETPSSLDADPQDPQADEPQTRAVVFRSVPRALGVRAAERWRAGLLQGKPELAEAIGAETPPMDWLPASLFSELLEAGACHPDGGADFPASLARATVRASFRRFFPAAAATLVPASTLAALREIWFRYHTWGEPTTVSVSAGQGVVRVANGLRDPRCCQFISGMVEQLLTLSGGVEVEVAHHQCASQGAEVCLFEARWQEGDSESIGRGASGREARVSRVNPSAETKPVIDRG